MVFSIYSYDPYCECDLYMGLASAKESAYWSEYHYITFPNLPDNNSFLSGGVVSDEGSYNCFAWSVGIKSGGAIWRNRLSQWDDFYEYHGYTREGANADNAAIALWGYNDSVMLHASVRKNSKNPYPHGFEWESKIGINRDRIMHTRDALVNLNAPNNENTYGCIQHYYRPIDETVNYSLQSSSKIRESSFSISELNRVSALKNNIPATILSGFETKYFAWEKTWDRPEIAIHSDPFMYAQSSEYKSLLKYCMKYGKAIWPLLFDKLAQRDIFVINLLRDLTYDGKPDFVTGMMSSLPVKAEPFPSLHSMQVDYCKGLLAKEEVNMQKSIQNIAAAEIETSEVSVTVTNSREMQISLNSGKDEKALVRIYNVFGGLEYEAGYNLSKGSQTVVINTSNFKKGISIVQITIGGESISRTISIN